MEDHQHRRRAMKYNSMSTSWPDQRISTPAYRLIENRDPTVEVPLRQTSCLRVDIQITPRRRCTITFTHSMAGGKKKKKPASNPARGFATTSTPSKPKVERIEDLENTAEEPASTCPLATTNNDHGVPTLTNQTEGANTATEELTPEEFERQLNESELQLLVEKHAQKSKRDAARQITRLQTDRRLLRGQAEHLSTKKWLSPELMDHILQLVQSDSRIADVSANAETPAMVKALSEEDLTIRLWTLQQTLDGAGFTEDKIKLALRYVLKISTKVATGNKDATIWGLDEALDWLARECGRKELPDYDTWQTRSMHTPSASTVNIRMIPTYERYSDD